MDRIQVKNRFKQRMEGKFPGITFKVLGFKQLLYVVANADGTMSAGFEFPSSAEEWLEVEEHLSKVVRVYFEL